MSKINIKGFAVSLNEDMAIFGIYVQSHATPQSDIFRIGYLAVANSRITYDWIIFVDMWALEYTLRSKEMCLIYNRIHEYSMNEPVTQLISTSYLRVIA